jgi:predicted nucleic acid-binding protein
VIDRVLDASAMVMALSGRDPDADTLRNRLPGMRRHAPHLIDAEVGNVLRRHERAALLTSSEAAAALRAAQVLIQHRYPHTGALADLAWTYRGDLSFYDALYVALAVRLDIPLVTCDARLANAPSLRCAVELV